MNDLDPSLLQSVLMQPSSAVGYSLGRALSQHVHPRFVLEVPGSEIDVWPFAHSGRCEVALREGIHSQTGVTWRKRGVLDTSHGTSWMTVRWEGHDLEVVFAIWDRDMRRDMAHWVIAETEAIARSFATALTEHSALPPEALLVFSNGCWSKDASAFTAVHKARSEDLILPEGLLDRVLRDARQFLASRETYKQYGLPYKRGLLFTGPPGNGKTACLRVVLRELGLPVLVVRSFNSRYGEVEQNVSAAFERAKRAAPCVLVLEDLDVLVRGSALSALLNELDGLGADTGILTLATSNHPELLDPALSERPSRFDRVYPFDLPNLALRRRFLAHWNARAESALGIAERDLDDLADRTDGFSFAFLQELVMSATVRWVADGGERTMAEILPGELHSLLAQRRASAAASPQRTDA